MTQLEFEVVVAQISNPGSLGLVMVAHRKSIFQFPLMFLSKLCENIFDASRISGKLYSNYVSLLRHLFGALLWSERSLKFEVSIIQILPIDFHTYMFMSVLRIWFFIQTALKIFCLHVIYLPGIALIDIVQCVFCFVYPY